MAGHPARPAPIPASIGLAEDAALSRKVRHPPPATACGCPTGILPAGWPASPPHAGRYRPSAPAPPCPTPRPRRWRAVAAAIADHIPAQVIVYQLLHQRRAIEIHHRGVNIQPLRASTLKWIVALTFKAAAVSPPPPLWRMTACVPCRLPLPMTQAFCRFSGQTLKRPDASARQAANNEKPPALFLLSSAPPLPCLNRTFSLHRTWQVCKKYVHYMRYLPV